MLRERMQHHVTRGRARHHATDFVVVVVDLRLLTDTSHHLLSFAPISKQMKRYRLICLFILFICLIVIDGAKSKKNLSEKKKIKKKKKHDDKNGKEKSSSNNQHGNKRSDSKKDNTNLKSNNLKSNSKLKSKSTNNLGYFSNEKQDIQNDASSSIKTKVLKASKSPNIQADKETKDHKISSDLDIGLLYCFFVTYIN